MGYSAGKNSLFVLFRLYARVKHPQLNFAQHTMNRCLTEMNEAFFMLLRGCFVELSLN